jgi:transglutaminase-like putative cysteine protease
MPESTWRPTRSEVVDAALVGALSIVALIGFHSSYGGVEFLVVGALGTVLGLALGTFAQRRRLPILAVVGVGIVLYVVVGGAVALRDQAIAGFIPSVDTLRGATRGAVAGWRQLITTQPPVAGIGDLMVLPFLCGLAAASSSLVLSGRAHRNGWCLLPATGVLGLSIATGTIEPAALVLQGVGFAALCVVWLTVKQHRGEQSLVGSASLRSRAIPAAGLMAVAAVGGVSLSSHLPMADASDRKVWREVITPPLDPRQYPSPLSGLRAYLIDDDLKDTTLLTVSGLPPGARLRLATMDDYDGLVWRPAYQSDRPSAENSGYFQRMGAEIPLRDGAGEMATVIVTVGEYRDVWVPDVGEVRSLRFEGGPRDDQLNAALRFNQATNTAVSTVPLQQGDRYVMTVRVPTDPPVRFSDLSIDGTEYVPPVDAPGTIKTWAQPIIINAATPGERIDALVDRLRGGAYSDGSSDLPSRPGHSAERLTAFVGNETTPLIGNAEQYAATMGLAAAQVGPVRVVMGFRPPIVSSTQAVEVKGTDVDAWVEVPVVGKGWVPVDVTPDKSSRTPKPQPSAASQPDYRTQVPPPPPLVEPDFKNPAESKSQAKKTEEPENKKEPISDDAGGLPTAVLVGGAVVGLPLLLFGLVVGVITWLKLRRRKRRRTSGATHERIANGWQEFTDNAVDIGKPVPTTATRREAAQFVAPSSVALAERADAAVFGPAQPTDDEVDRYWTDLTAQLDAMHSELSFTERIKARLSISSFTRPQRSSKRSNTGKGSR